MSIPVEPLDGSDLERLVTVLLNVTGCVHTMIEAELDVGFGGIAVIDEVAEAVRQLLAPVAEHHDDDELALAVEIFAESSLLLAHGIGMDDVFSYPAGP
ncbi:MAG: hypothetical protein JWM73_224 [Solirubrobacterales bacterium]|nr:hypothetical protein [Solirubrobacterales bacterium]